MFGFNAFGVDSFASFKKPPGTVWVAPSVLALAIAPPVINPGVHLDIPTDTPTEIDYPPQIRSSLPDYTINGPMFGFGTWGKGAFAETPNAGEGVNIVVPILDPLGIDIYAPVINPGVRINIPEYDLALTSYPLQISARRRKIRAQWVVS